ncbi:MAG: taurine ABC transporter ATP-binding subunit, partial [Tagaea sp.]|nr:taurine ABC transporter ATP-binding subunit [Tagaea sp.]
EEACFLGDRVAVLTPGPGKVKEIVAIDIPRERRNWATLGADPEFARIKERVLASVRGVPGAGS